MNEDRYHDINDNQLARGERQMKTTRKLERFSKISSFINKISTATTKTHRNKHSWCHSLEIRILFSFPRLVSGSCLFSFQNLKMISSMMTVTLTTISQMTHWGEIQNLGKFFENLFSHFPTFYTLENIFPT